MLNRNRFFLENVDLSRDFRTFEPKSEIFGKCWPKSGFSISLTEIDFFFSKNLTEIEIFKIVNRNPNCFQNVERYRNFEPKSKYFRKLLPKSWFSNLFYRNSSFFSKMLTEIEILKFWTEIEILSKMFNEIGIFKMLNRNWFFFRKRGPKRGYWKIWTQIEILSKMLTVIVIFQIFYRNRNFFENVGRNRDFRIFNRYRIFFFENVDQIRDFRNFEANSKYFFENVDQNRDFRYFEPKSKSFRKLLPKSWFSKFRT